MTPMEIAYLTLVVAATVIFMATLAGVTWWTNRR
jgi:hypothetical protein